MPRIIKPLTGMAKAVLVINRESQTYAKANFPLPSHGLLCRNQRLCGQRPALFPWSGTAKTSSPTL